MNLFVREARALWSALLYFTRLPLPAPADYDPEDLRRASGWWPLTGLLLGALVASLWLMLSVVLPGALASALALLAGVLLTGAMHEDGLADVCDGMGGGSTPERVLEIMKDSAVGAYGALAIAFSLLVRWQCLCSLTPQTVMGVLLCAHGFSRACAVGLMSFLDYARIGPSKARPLAHRMSAGRLTLALVLGLAPALLLPLDMLWVLALPVVTTVAAGLWFRRRIGGYTGDCLGAAQQLGEIALLLGVIGTLYSSQ